MPPISYLILVGIAVFALVSLARWIWSRYEWAEPNQWLILIRRGKPIDAGIGIRFWRLPGDTVARFTSTMQRVTFDTEVYTEDKQKIQVKGFILWAVSGDDKSAPFQAFSKLGIAHREARMSNDPLQHHALSKPQHHAFRNSVEAVVRKSAVLFALRDLLSAPGLLSQKVAEELRQTILSWGILLESVEITDLSVTQKELFEHLQAPYISHSRQEAEEILLASETQLAQMRREQDKENALKQAQVARLKELEIARIDLEKEQEKAQMFAEQIEVQKQQLAKEQAWQQAQAEAKHQQRLEEIAREELRRQRQEEQEQAITALVEQRRNAETEARLHRLQRERDAERQHLQAMLAIEREKPQEVRQAELSKAIVETASEALQSLPIRDIRWLSSSTEHGPAGLMLGFVDAIQQLVPSISTAISTASDSSLPFDE